VVFRSDEGTKLEAASRGGRVAFEVDGADAATRSGWSVLVRGEATEVTDPTELARLRKLPLSPWAPGPKTRYVRILPTVLTGRRIALAEDAPWTWWG
jgi:nitroimidazol reductase NimA-like FMN-containing flavoprotein (pyridoxamine 5'-phosphate oxidase superfamily)